MRVGLIKQQQSISGKLVLCSVAFFFFFALETRVSCLSNEKMMSPVGLDVRLTASLGQFLYVRTWKIYSLGSMSQIFPKKFLRIALSLVKFLVGLRLQVSHFCANVTTRLHKLFSYYYCTHITPIRILKTETGCLHTITSKIAGPLRCRLVIVEGLFHIDTLQRCSLCPLNVYLKRLLRLQDCLKQYYIKNIIQC